VTDAWKKRIAHRAARHRRRRLVATLAAAAVATMTVVGTIWFLAPPVAPPLEERSEPVTTPPETPTAPPPPRVVSRSRGRTDWLFFFKPGDWLVRMADDGLLGVVLRTEKSHRFADGSLGPAYVIQTMEGEERVTDADELERTARLR
jgi:hypothetical protein